MKLRAGLPYLLIKLQSVKVGVAKFAGTPSKLQRLRSPLIEPDVPGLLGLINLLLRSGSRINRFSPESLILDKPIVELVQAFKLIVTSERWCKIQLSIK